MLKQLLPPINPVSRSFSYPDLLYNFQFADSHHLYGMNKDGIWLSRDTSKTWEIIFSLKGRYGECFSFYNSKMGVVFHDYWNGSITTDGGLTWKEFNKIKAMRASKSKFLAYNFKDEYQVFAIGEEGEMQLYLLSKNGEVILERTIDTYTKQSLNDIDVVIENNIYQIWIAGYGFTLLNYDAGGIFLGVERQTLSIPQYELSQNYPNPFNPETTIGYSLSKPAYTKLIVYNVLGEQMLELVNRYQQVGTYKIKFNASILPSGIYFYTITTGNFHESKKMILLK